MAPDKLDAAFGAKDDRGVMISRACFETNGGRRGQGMKVPSSDHRVHFNCARARVSKSE